jgi:uncharacterized membrane protein YdbT with pleckstrin-like domain
MAREDLELIPGETLLLQVNRHWLVLVASVWKWIAGYAVILAAAILVHLTGSSSTLRWFALLGVTLLLLVYIDVRYIVWRSENYTLTDERVIVRRGVVGKFIRSTSMSRVQDVTTRQRLLGRLFNFGSVEIESAGRDGAEVLTYVPDPQHFRNVLFERLHPDLARGGSAPV